MSLHKKKCIPCEKGAPPLRGEKLNELYKELNPEWKLIDGHHLAREYKFKDFKEALAFTNKAGLLADRENHHPDILLSWGKITITLYTHKINGLSEADFILAAKYDQIV